METGWMSGKDDRRKKLIIAHRGASSSAKENTIESFEKALGLGADMIEFDVRRTKDDILIAFHDETIQGYSTKNLTWGTIRQMAKDRGVDMPALEEVLKWARGKIKLDVELKEEGYEKEAVESLLRYLEEDQFLITSFNDASISVIKARYPDIEAGLILGRAIPPYRILTRFRELFPARRCKKTGTDFLVAHLKLLRTGFLERARKNHLPVFVWTANDEKTIRKLLHDPRVYAIITDKPDLAVSLRKETLQSS